MLSNCISLKCPDKMSRQMLYIWKIFDTVVNDFWCKFQGLPRPLIVDFMFQIRKFSMTMQAGSSLFIINFIVTAYRFSIYSIKA